MGVIQRQGFKSSIISYIGVGIGVISTLYVYPNALEILGLFRSLFDAAVLIGIFVMMGTGSSAIRFFPRYQGAHTGHGGLLSWLLIVAGIGFLLFLLLYPFIQHWIRGFIFHERNEMYSDFVIYVIPLTFFLALINLLSRYISNFRRIAIPAAIEQLTIKITLPLIILMYLQGWINVKGVIIGVVASFGFAALAMIWYLAFLGEWRLGKPVITKDKLALKEFSSYSWYGLLSGIGSQIAFRIDGLMVSGMIQFQATGIYAISWALSEIIAKPMRSLSSIASPLLAQHIEQGNMEEVKTIYRKSSINMTIIGLGLFMLIWTVLPYVFEIMSNTSVMRQGAYVVFFLGLSQVWDMMTGVNSEIISYSRYYRFTLYLTLILAGTNIAANLLFIPMYGLTGAALATCLSMVLYNIAKLVYIQMKFGFHPFTYRMIPAIGFCLAAWLISRAIPDTTHHFFNLLYKGTVFSALFGGAVLWFKVSPEINTWVSAVWSKVLKR